LVQANRKVCGLLGFNRTELCSLPVSALVHPEDRETEFEQRKRLAAGEIPGYELVLRWIRQDGGVAWVRLSVSALRSPASICAVMQLMPVPPYNCAGPEVEHDWFSRLGEATLSTVHEIGNSLTPLMLNTQMLVEQSRDARVRDSAQEIFAAARRIAFSLKRLQRIQDPYPVAYIGQNRLLDLPMIAPTPIDEREKPAEGAA
jgi:hypothetical protein